MRLFFCRVLENGEGPTFIKESMIRMPLRLGHDAFTENKNMYCWTTWPNSGTKLAKIKSCINNEKSSNSEILLKSTNVTVKSGTNESKDVNASDDATCKPFAE